MTQLTGGEAVVQTLIQPTASTPCLACQACKTTGCTTPCTTPKTRFASFTPGMSRVQATWRWAMRRPRADWRFQRGAWPWPAQRQRGPGHRLRPQRARFLPHRANSLGQIGQGLGVLHEIPDQLAILRGLTKWAARVNSPAEAPAILHEAFAQLQNGRPRPVAVEVPMDVLAKREDVELGNGNGRIPSHTQSRPHQTSRQSTRPGQTAAHLVGSGAQNVSAEVRELATMLEAPVVGYRTGMGIMDGRHYLSLHLPPAHELWKTTDAVLLIGTHGRIPLKSWGVDDEMTLIKIDIDPKRTSCSTHQTSPSPPAPKRHCPCCWNDGCPQRPSRQPRR